MRVVVGVPSFFRFGILAVEIMGRTQHGQIEHAASHVLMVAGNHAATAPPAEGRVTLAVPCRQAPADVYGKQPKLSVFAFGKANQIAIIAIRIGLSGFRSRASASNRALRAAPSREARCARSNEKRSMFQSSDV